jgi:hypothetical protein
MSNDMAELEQDLHWIFMELEGGMGLSKDQIDTLKYACGFNPKTVAVSHLDNLFKDFGNIFRSNK